MPIETCAEPSRTGLFPDPQTHERLLRDIYLPLYQFLASSLTTLLHLCLGSLFHFIKDGLVLRKECLLFLCRQVAKGLSLDKQLHVILRLLASLTIDTY